MGVFFCTFHFCFGKDGVGDEELQIDDCLSVNRLTGTETVGGFLMALSQTTALSKQYVTLKMLHVALNPTYLSDQSG